MIIGGKMTNPGEMRTQITLGTRSITEDAGGFDAPGFTAVMNVWSKWTNVFGAEAWQAEALQAEDAATVRVRWRSDIDPTWLVRKGGNVFEIVSMDNIQERNELIEMKVKRWRGG